MIARLINNSFIENYSADRFRFKTTGMHSCAMFDSLKLNYGDTLNCRISVIWGTESISISYDMYVKDSMGGCIHHKRDTCAMELTLCQMQRLFTIINNLFEYWTELSDEYLNRL